MFFFRKKASEKTREDKELVEQNNKAIEALLVLADGNEYLTDQLKELQEKLKYLIATETKEVQSCDKKIRDLIGDMRIALTKGDGETTKKAENLLTQIKLTLADRNAKI